MTTYAERAINIKAAMAELKAQRTADTGKMMFDELALVSARVVENGATADGGSPGGYSEALVPYWYHGSSVKNADFNIKAKQKEILKAKGYFSSYKDWREINNRPTAFKNFSFTGKMWKSIKPIVLNADDLSTTYVFGSDDAEMQRLIDFNKAQSGDFLATSDSEFALLQKLNLQRVLNVFRKYKLA